MAALVGGCSASRPPVAAPSNPPVAAVAPPVTPSPAPIPGDDPTDRLMRAAEDQFAAGQHQLQAGHLTAAREAFDRAVDTLLTSPMGARGNDRLSAYFDKLLGRISALEASALREGDGFTETRSEPAVIDSLLSAATFPAPPPAHTTAEIVAADLLVTPHDVPIPVNDRVLSYVELFEGNLKSFLEDGLARGARYLPMIEDVFRTEGVPLDLAYVPLIESAFKANALSTAAAKGMWQFESDTAVEQGLVQNWFIDERSDPEKATRAAAAYLKELYQMFGGDWNLALASYNGGMGRVDAAMHKSGLSDYWQLSASSKYLPSETREYVPMILAAIIVARDPTQYGVTVPPTAPLAYDKVMVPDAVDLRLVAEWTGSTLETIRELNPELRRFTTPLGSHELKIPLGTAAAFTEKLNETDPLQWTYFERRVVKSGETLATIARQYRIKTADLAGANLLKTSAKLQKGQKLLIPVAPSASLASHAAPAASPKAAAAPVPSLTTYRVKPGDTLFGLALRFDTTVDDIKRSNNLKTDVINIGDRLTIHQHQ